MKLNLSILTAVLAATFIVTAPLVWAHGDAGHDKKPARKISTDEHAFGKEGDPKKAKRTITVNMADTMRFTPGEITVKQGETVKFVVRNGGKVMHEMVIGTEEELKKHAEQMKKHPNMEHDEPYMAHVKPGGKEEIAWTFTKPGTYMYGCLIPGHFEAGMKGAIKVVAK
jgi:uncharacterized cupredoxin-like copper-binding protein